MDVIDLTPDEVPAAHDAADAELAPTVTFYGQRFAVRQNVSLLPLMKFATIAKRHSGQTDRGVTDPAADGRREMEALAALFELLEQCIAEHDFGAFYDHALANGASQPDLMHVVRDAMQAAAGRPTRQPSGSQGGRQATAPSSAAGSSSPASSVPQGSLEVQRSLEERGRPDVGLVVLRAREASTRRSAG